ncbi:MAG: calcium/proton exchanger [Actinobacteria bacterium]|nr:MAG: calcium/proton exchanger [Actinomycetota bacterium]
MQAPESHTPRLDTSFFFGPHGWPYLLVPFIPAAIVLYIAGTSDVVVFVCSTLGIIPTAALMGRATEELAARSGPGIGGLLNVTFGNAPELIIALFALGNGLHELVKATLIGSIIGNILLVLGASMLVGGLGRQKQRFSATNASAQSSMLLAAAAAFAMPAIFQLVHGDGLPAVGVTRPAFDNSIEVLSGLIAGVLILVYIAGLFFSLRTHRAVFNPEYEQEGSWGWSTRTSIVMLAIAGVAVGGMSDILVHSVSAASESLGLSEFFIGAIVVAIVGNAAEHWVAVLVAHKDKMDLSVNIAIGSSAQVALFVTPVLVLAGFFVGPSPLPLVFNGYELGALILSALIAAYVAHEGESTWFEGVQLLAVYAVMALVFAFA